MSATAMLPQGRQNVLAQQRERLNKVFSNGVHNMEDQDRAKLHADFKQRFDANKARFQKP